MSSKQLRQVRKELTRIGKDRPYLPPGVRCLGYVPGIWAENLHLAVKIAYENGYIPKKTLYAYTTEAIKTYTNAILKGKTAVKENLDS